MSFHYFFEQVDCPKCGSKTGKHCFFVEGSSEIDKRCHKERYQIALKVGFKTQGTIYCPRTPKPKKKAREGPQYANHHPEGWMSANCTKKSCGTCFSMKCACECHRREQGM